MATININSDAMVKMTAKLETVGRNALPMAVRGTLNTLAFDVKKRTLPKSAKDTFETRQKTFIKAFSRVNPSKGGTDIESMKSEVGFFDRGAKSKQAVEDLEEQEHGGRIAGRSYVPLAEARTGKKDNGMVAAKNRMSKIRLANVVHAPNVKAETKKQRFIRAAFKSKKMFGSESYVLGNKHKGGQTLSRIDSIEAKGGKIVLKRTPLYTYKSGRTVAVQKTQFAKRAAYETGLTVDRVWLVEGRRQFAKLMSK